MPEIISISQRNRNTNQSQTSKQANLQQKVLNAKHLQTVGGSPDRARVNNDFPPLSQSLRKVYNNNGNRYACRSKDKLATSPILNNSLPVYYSFSVYIAGKRNQGYGGRAIKNDSCRQGKVWSVHTLDAHFSLSANSKITAAGGELSASQGPKRPNNREEVLKSGANKLKKKSAGSGAELFRVAHDQPATSINLEPGPSRMLPSTQPTRVNPILAGMRNTATAAKKTKSKLKDSRRVTLPHGTARKTASMSSYGSDIDHYSNLFRYSPILL